VDEFSQSQPCDFGRQYRDRLRKGVAHKPEADELTIPVVDAGSGSLGAGISNSGLLKDTAELGGLGIKLEHIVAAVRVRLP